MQRSSFKNTFAHLTTMSLVSVVLVMMSVAWAVQGFSSGAPQSACLTMVPQHPVSPQSSKPPYTLTTNVKEVKQGGRVEVKISGKSPSDTVGGLLLVARAGGKPTGKFEVRSSDPFAQLLDCNGPGTAVTHKKHNSKNEKNSLTFSWTAPADYTGNVVFRATIALNGAVFWVGVDSAPVKVIK